MGDYPWGFAMSVLKSDVYKLLSMKTKADDLAKSWRKRLGELFPENSEVQFALMRNQNSHVTHHTGTVSRHQFFDPDDKIVLAVDPDSIPEWIRSTISKPCECCGKCRLAVSLFSVIHCLDK